MRTEIIKKQASSTENYCQIIKTMKAPGSSLSPHNIAKRKLGMFVTSCTNICPYFILMISSIFGNFLTLCMKGLIFTDHKSMLSHEKFDVI